MDEVQLSETEKRYFSDLFVCCDVENTGKVPQNKAFELFRSGNIPQDVLNQITEICQFKAGFLSRPQFYSFLKLIAAHQANLPLNDEVLISGVETPLPRFTWPATENLIELSCVDASCTDSDAEVTDTNVPNGSPELSSTASDSPTPTNSVQERNWAALGDWRGLCEEQRQLLGTEEESSDRHSSEEDTEVATEVWTITPEQRDYYAHQFKQLQPDIRGCVAGNVARKFFEKSMLPVAELRKIWQLSDVTKDGMLNLAEFNTAMHLVVLRRNHISLPAVLPAQLNPELKMEAQTAPNLEAQFTQMKMESAQTAPNIEAQFSQIKMDAQTAPNMETQLKLEARPLSPQMHETKETWTKFIDSPTSSPGPKPVNFDFQKGAVEADPKILHPKALRLTPEISNPQLEEIEDLRPIQRPQPKKIGNHRGAIPPPPAALPAVHVPDEGPTPKKDKPPPPPPRPIRSHGRSSSLDLNRLGKNGFLGAGAPPSIPPRVSPNITPMKKLINQRSEGGDTFADFDHFEAAAAEKYENVSDQVDAAEISVSAPAPPPQAEPQIRRHGAFEVYRKPIVPPVPPPVSAPVTAAPLESPVPVPAEDSAKYELYKKLKEQNLVLLRLCQELSQELADVREERTTLRLRLEQQQSAS